MPRGVYPRESSEVRFLRRVYKTDDCWLWTGGRIKASGYGSFWSNGKTVSAHRWSYMHFVGKIPPGMSVLHSCDQPSCVRPSHLRLGTQKDNVHDMIEKGRRATLRGSDAPWSKLTERDVCRIRKLAETTSHVAIAVKYGLSSQHVGAIVRRECWSHVC
jgi:hypothetical protein